MRRGHGWSMPQGLLIHLLLHRDLSQRPAIITLVAANPPFLDPFFLDVRLAAFRADEHSLFIVHEPFFFHCFPRSVDTLRQGSRRDCHSLPPDCKPRRPGLVQPWGGSSWVLPCTLLFEFFLYQHPTEHRAHQRLGKLGSELNLLWNLELRQIMSTVVQDVGDGGVLTILEHHVRLDQFSAQALQDTGDDRLLDLRMPDKHLLDFARVHILTP